MTRACPKNQKSLSCVPSLTSRGARQTLILQRGRLKKRSIAAITIRPNRTSTQTLNGLFEGTIKQGRCCLPARLLHSLRNNNALLPSRFRLRTERERQSPSHASRLPLTGEAR